MALPNIPVHISKIGINQDNVFHDIEDYETFYNFMKSTSQKLEIKIYAYVILKDSFEFIVSSSVEENISKFMQILGRQYVLHYNKKYNRTGTIWEGRYKSSLVEKETFLSKVISYIDYISIKNNLVNSVCSSLKEIYDVKLNLNEIEFIHNSLNSNSITGSSKFIQTVKNTTGICFFEK